MKSSATKPFRCPWLFLESIFKSPSIGSALTAANPKVEKRGSRSTRATPLTTNRITMPIESNHIPEPFHVTERY